jgi:hypothetical protein
LADPRLGFFAKFAAVASITAAGLGMVNAIKGGGGGSSAGGSSRGYTPSSASQAQAASPATANVTIVGNTVSSTSVKDLIDQLNGAFKQGYKLNLVTQ